MNKVVFFIGDQVHLLDLAGAVQVFYESGVYGAPYDIRFVSDQPEQLCSSHMGISALERFSEVDLFEGDIVIVPGYNLKRPRKEGLQPVYDWLKKVEVRKAFLCSICTGAFLLAEAGLLDGKECTTHWLYTDKLQKEYPATKVYPDKLFVRSGFLYTSAGVTTGIDLALYLLEERHGASLAYAVARDLVVYIRRDGGEAQESVYLQHRQHISHSVHEVQDWIIHHLGDKLTIGQLADMVHTSPRNLTRLFKINCGVTIGQYMEKLRVEKALQLLRENGKIEQIARDCGFRSTNQLRSLFRKFKGKLPSAYRSLI